MAFFIIAKAINLAKVLLLLFSKRLGVTPFSWSITFSAFLWGFFLLFLLGFITFSFFSLISLFSLIGIILVLILGDCTGFLLSFFRLVAGVDNYFQRSLSLRVPLVEVGVSINPSFSFCLIGFTN